MSTIQALPLNDFQKNSSFLFPNIKITNSVILEGEREPPGAARKSSGNFRSKSLVSDHGAAPKNGTSSISRKYNIFEPNKSISNSEVWNSSILLHKVGTNDRNQGFKDDKTAKLENSFSYRIFDTDKSSKINQIKPVSSIQTSQVLFQSQEERNLISIVETARGESSYDFQARSYLRQSSIPKKIVNPSDQSSLVNSNVIPSSPERRFTKPPALPVLTRTESINRNQPKTSLINGQISPGSFVRRASQKPAKTSLPNSKHFDFQVELGQSNRPTLDSPENELRLNRRVSPLILNIEENIENEMKIKRMKSIDAAQLEQPPIEPSIEIPIESFKDPIPKYKGIKLYFKAHWQQINSRIFTEKPSFCECELIRKKLRCLLNRLFKNGKSSQNDASPFRDIDLRNLPLHNF